LVSNVEGLEAHIGWGARDARGDVGDIWVDEEGKADVDRGGGDEEGTPNEPFTARSPEAIIPNARMPLWAIFRAKSLKTCNVVHTRQGRDQVQGFEGRVLVELLLGRCVVACLAAIKRS